MEPAFNYEILASPLHDRELLRRSMTPFGERLHRLDGVGAPPDRSPTIPYVIVVATGGTEGQILDRWRKRQQVHPGDTTLLLTHDDDDALSAALEALARLQQEGGRGRIVMTDDPPAVIEAISDTEARATLARARIGVVGEPSDWLLASTTGEQAITERWGPVLVPLETADLVEAGRSDSTEVAVTLGRRWANGDRGSSFDRTDIERAARVYQPLIDQFEDHDLDAVTVRCLDLFDPARTSGCLAVAELNDQGRVAGCEGDLPSVVAMLWVRSLLGSASWMANPTRIDAHAGELVLAHCTVAPGLVEDYELSTHLESGVGVAVAGRFRRQPITLLRLGGSQLDASWIVEGDVVAGGPSEQPCRTEATVSIGPEEATALLERPLGSHLVLVPGHHAERLRAWWRLFIADPG